MKMGKIGFKDEIGNFPKGREKFPRTLDTGEKNLIALGTGETGKIFPWMLGN